MGAGQQYRKLLAYHQAELEFTEGALREVARVAHERGTGARGLRAVVEAVLEPILFDPKPWTTYLVTEEAVRGGEVRVLDYGDLPAAPLRSRVIRRAATTN